MKKLAELTNLTRWTCGNWDCKKYGKRSYTRGKCPRCRQDLISWEEYEWIERQFTGDDVPTPSSYVANGVKIAPKPDDTFRCPETLTGCPIAERPELRVPYTMYLEWIYLCKEFDCEWIAYLVGTQLESGSYEVTSMVFPAQRATGVHVEVTGDERAPEGTVAAVHSHVNMEVFFSEEDAAHFNHRFELVVNRNGEVKANGLSKLACGRTHRGDARVLLVGTQSQVDTKERLKARLTEVKFSGFSLQ